MVNKITVYPEGVRGLGNVLEPKTSSDYQLFNSSIELDDTEAVNGLPLTVFGLTYDSTRLGSFEINNEGHLIYNIEGETDVSFSINEFGHLIVSGTDENKFSIVDGHLYYGG